MIKRRQTCEESARHFDRAGTGKSCSASTTSSFIPLPTLVFPMSSPPFWRGSMSRRQQFREVEFAQTIEFVNEDGLDLFEDSLGRPSLESPPAGAAGGQVDRDVLPASARAASRCPPDRPGRRPAGGAAWELAGARAGAGRGVATARR